MSTPAAKRRRVDIASQTLSRPFRSPFKTPFKSPLQTPPSHSTHSISQHIGIKPIENPQIPLNEVGAPPTLPSPSTATSTRTNRPKKTTSAAALNSDPDIAALLRTQRELEKQLRELKVELDTATQAKKIETTSGVKVSGGEVDGELVGLISKWKAASRQAAEEMFGAVRDRVNRMGGPRAWKEMQKKQQEFQNGWDQEEQNTNNNSDDEGVESKDTEKRDLYAEYDIDPETEIEKAQHGDTEEDPGQEDEFTMAMMLRTLNVDLKVIGYDREQQRWDDQS